MHAAPPVRIACNAGSGWMQVQRGLFAVAAAAVAGWLGAWMELSSVAQGLAAGAGLLAGFSLGLAVTRLPADRGPTTLLWSGQTWRIGDADGAIEVMIDLGGWMLLRWRAESGGRSRWLSVGAGDAGFHLWRVALHAPVVRSASTRQDGPGG